MLIGDQPSERALKVSISTSSWASQLARIRLCAIPSRPVGIGERTLRVSVVGAVSPLTFTLVPDAAGSSDGHGASDWPAANFTSAFLPLAASVRVTFASPLLSARQRPRSAGLAMQTLPDRS